MNLQITPVGIVLAAPFYALAFFVLRRLWRRYAMASARWAVLGLAPALVVLPFADELWIAWHFEQACKDAGVTVYRKVEAEGYLVVTDPARRYKNDATTPRRISIEGTTLDQWVKDMNGYQFKEQQLDDGGAWHVELRGDGIYGHVVDRPQARYHYRRAHKATWAPAGFQMGRNEMQVVDSQSGEILGRNLSFKRFPGLIEGLWIRFLGSGQTICPDPAGPRLPDFPESVLIPKKLNANNRGQTTFP